MRQNEKRVGNPIALLPIAVFLVITIVQWVL